MAEQLSSSSCSSLTGKLHDLYVSLDSSLSVPATWNAFDIEKMNGCAIKCCINVHKVNPLDISLIIPYHTTFYKLANHQTLESRQNLSQASCMLY